MEVFVHNLPREGDLSDQGLLIQLQPFMRALQIADYSYDCEKAAKKRHAFITFANERDGLRFLDAHGEIIHKIVPGMNRGKSRMPRNISRLKLLGAHVMCRRSDRPASRAVLGVLAARAEMARVEKEHASSLKTAPSTASTKHGTSAAESHMQMQYDRFSCGYCKFNSDGRLAFIPEYVEEPHSYEPCLAKFGRRHLTLSHHDGMAIYIPLSSIQEIVWSPHGTLTLILLTVPLFFSPISGDKRSRMTALDKRHAQIVGMCLVYQLMVRSDSLHHKMKRLADLGGGLTVTRYEMGIASGPDVAESDTRLRSLLGAMAATASFPISILMQLQALASNAYLPAETVSGLARQLVDAHREMPISPEAMKQLMQAIDWPSPNHPDPGDFEVPALVDYVVETERGLADGRYVRASFVNPGGNLTPIHRVMVTPTHMTLHGPELENKNRVLRKFPKHHDYFLRVQFCDEDGQALRFNGRVDYTAVYSRFRNVMVNGIQVAGRTYRFLGWSHSSLRAHSMWFVAPFIDDKGNLQTHFTIISTLGEFGNIYSPARCAARIGQAFSETPFAISLTDNGITVMLMPDVSSPVDSARLFSDGVGTISVEAAQCIWKQLPRGKKQPTCFQIRYAGAKGMLSLDTRLQGRIIRLRPSMIKFESGEKTNLEICDMAAQPIPLYLNRQLIKILEDMGVPTAWFQKRQAEVVRELRLITSSPYNMASFLKAQSVATAIKLHKLLLLADRLGLDFRSDPFLRRATDAVILRELRLIKHKARIFVPEGITLFGIMDETGFLQENEVYLTFDTPKKGSKSQRFRWPPDNGAPVLVTRSPALHPGDIQLALSVHPPLHDKNGGQHPLRALRNCIVFSQYGCRDLPSQLSGGDLDGDIFNVIWDPEICRWPSLQTYTPANYPRQEPLNIGREVKTEDIADFFLDFMRTDHLGSIATRHMILADQLPDGTLENSCVQVAEMHSTAVDFSKTGIPADLKNLPRTNRFRPDFLSPGPIVKVYSHKDIDLDEFSVKEEDDEGEKHELDAPQHKDYESMKTLGLLYRAIDERNIWQDVQKAPENTSFYDTFLAWATRECELLGCADWQARAEEAQRIHSAYEDAMVTTMYEFSEHPTLPLTEIEVFIGTIINKTGAQTLRQRDRSRKLHDEYERISAWITAQMRPPKKKPATPGSATAVRSVNTGSDDDDDSEDEDDGGGAWLSQRTAILELCLACVYAQKGKRSGRRKEENKVESFWLVAGSALIRELELIRYGLELEADLQQDMQQLSLEP